MSDEEDVTTTYQPFDNTKEGTKISKTPQVPKSSTEIASTKASYSKATSPRLTSQRHTLNTSQKMTWSNVLRTVKTTIRDNLDTHPSLEAPSRSRGGDIPYQIVAIANHCTNIQTSYVVLVAAAITNLNL